MAKGKRPFQKKKVGAAIRTPERTSEAPDAAKKPMKKKLRKAMGMGLAATAPSPAY